MNLEEIIGGMLEDVQTGKELWVVVSRDWSAGSNSGHKCEVFSQRGRAYEAMQAYYAVEMFSVTVTSQVQETAFSKRRQNEVEVTWPTPEPCEV